MSNKPMGPLKDSNDKIQKSKCEYDGEVNMLSEKCLCGMVFYCDV